MKAVSPSPAVSVHLEGWLLLLILSVREVFQTMLATKLATVFEPSKKLHLEWTAMVGLAGELRGVLMLSCDEKSATRITSKMLGVPLPGPNEQTADALGEVCNMIAGGFKHKVSGLSERCALSPPTVVTGKDYRVHRQESGSLHSLSVTFTFDGAPIYLSLEVLE
jgi:chemotaxis protein CheX